MQESGETIEWLELFFDPVVVAAVAVLTESLRENPSLAGLGMLSLLYGAIWLSWVSVVRQARRGGGCWAGPYRARCCPWASRPGNRLGSGWLTLGLLACVGWMVTYSRLARARAAAGRAVTRGG